MYTVTISKTDIYGCSVLVNGMPIVPSETGSDYEIFCGEHAEDVYSKYNGKAKLERWDGKTTVDIKSKDSLH